MNHGREEINGFVNQPRCARCGYDFIGDVESWKESCPVAGVCSECGLGFEWADVLRADRQRLGWLYEHAEHWWDVRRAWGTVIRALFPWQFWKKVQPHHNVRVRRLAMWLLVCIGSVWFVAGAVGSGAIEITTIGLDHPPPKVKEFRVSQEASGNAPVYDQRQTTRGTPLLKTPTPIASVRIIRPKTVSVSCQGKTAILSSPGRGGEIVYHDTPIGTVVIRRVKDLGWRHRQSVRREYAESIEDDAFIVLLVDQTELYDADDVMSHVGPWIQMFYSYNNWPLYGLFRLPYELFVTLAFLIPALAVVLAAPTEWRRAKVRRAHLWRITAYSFSLALFPVALEMLTYAWAYAGWLAERFGLLGLGGTMTPWSPPRALRKWASGQLFAEGVMVYVMAWLAVYWWFALKRGLRLERPFWLWFFVCFAGVAGVLNLHVARQSAMLDTYFSYYVPPYFPYWWL